jgi:4-carboxymuconolactone decarboxylase
MLGDGKTDVRKGLKHPPRDVRRGAGRQNLGGPDDFNRPFEELVNQYCFGEIWARPGLDRKTRSIATLSMLTGLNRPNQVRAHVKGAIANGVSKAELQELFLQAAIYCGVPAAVDSFRIAREVFKEMGI